MFYNIIEENSSFHKQFREENNIYVNLPIAQKLHNAYLFVTRICDFY